MGKALSIKDEATYELVAEFAAKSGLSMTQAVNRAVGAALTEMKAKRDAELQAWVKAMEANPLPEDFEFFRDTTPYEPRKIFD
jgi:hypothetical protein